MAISITGMIIAKSRKFTFFPGESEMSEEVKIKILFISYNICKYISNHKHNGTNIYTRHQHTGKHMSRPNNSYPAHSELPLASTKGNSRL